MIKIFFNSVKKRLHNLSCLTAGVFYSITSFAANDDPLSALLPTAKNAFGADSTFIHLMYLAEVIVCAYAYHKTKNFGALLGIFVLPIVTSFALNHWVFSA